MKPGDGETGAHSTFSYDLVTAYLSLVPSTRETMQSFFFFPLILYLAKDLGHLHSIQHPEHVCGSSGKRTLN